jgi:hypothetical protein
MDLSFGNGRQLPAPRTKYLHQPKKGFCCVKNLIARGHVAMADEFSFLSVCDIGHFRLYKMLIVKREKSGKIENLTGTRLTGITPYFTVTRFCVFVTVLYTGNHMHNTWKQP